MTKEENVKYRKYLEFNFTFLARNTVKEEIVMQSTAALKDRPNDMGTAPIKIAICDDNAEERKYFRELCKIVKQRKNTPILVKEYEHGASLLFDMSEPSIMHTVEIVLLDIAMPGDNGIEVARKLRQIGYLGEIIFLTRSAEHWQAAFSVRAFNYIVKDEKTGDRFVEVFWDALQEARKRQGESLLFSSISETISVKVNSMSHFVVSDHLVKLYYDNNRFDFISSINKIEELLFGNDHFIRIHRSCLVSIPYITKLLPKSVIMRNGDQLPVSRNNAAALKQAMAKYSILPFA